MNQFQSFSSHQVSLHLRPSTAPQLHRTPSPTPKCHPLIKIYAIRARATCAKHNLHCTWGLQIPDRRFSHICPRERSFELEKVVDSTTWSSPFPKRLKIAKCRCATVAVLSWGNSRNWSTTSRHAVRMVTPPRVRGVHLRARVDYNHRARQEGRTYRKVKGRHEPQHTGEQQVNLNQRQL